MAVVGMAGFSKSLAIIQFGYGLVHCSLARLMR